MNSSRLRPWFLAVLGAGTTLPLVFACQPNAGQQQPNTAASASVAYNYPPPGTSPPPPGYAPPPGYPGAQSPPPGYAPAQNGYPPPQGYPAGQQPPPGYPGAQPSPGYPPPQGGQTMPPGAPPPSGSASGSPAPFGTTDPNSLPGIIQGIQNAVQATMMPGSTAGAIADPTDAGLRLVALKSAQGMQPEGDEMKQNLSQGQHAVMMVTMQAGKCYALVGFSVPGQVQDLDLNLLAPPFYMTLAGQDQTHNNTPAIGTSPNPMCPVLAFPLQYKLDVFARQGSGVVAVQLYSKAKS